MLVEIIAEAGDSLSKNGNFDCDIFPILTVAFLWRGSAGRSPNRHYFRLSASVSHSQRDGDV